MTQARVVECECGWRGRRYVNANVRPCPRCGGRVYLSANRRGRPPTDTTRLRVWMPTRWVELLGDGPSAQVRELVRAELEARGFDPDG